MNGFVRRHHLQGPRKRGQHGQTLVEAAVTFPFLLILLLGVAQVGDIVVQSESTTTAAGAAALVAANHPAQALDFMQSSNSADQYRYSGDPTGWTSYDCAMDGVLGQGNTNTDASTESWICNTVVASAGTLTPANMSVTVTYIPPDGTSGSLSRKSRGGQHLLSSCLGTDATVSGVISNFPSGVTVATITSNEYGGGTATSNTDPSGNYTLCVAVKNGNGTSITVAASAGAGCSQVTQSGTAFTAQQGNTYSGTNGVENLTLPASSCSTPTPSATPTPTATPTATATPAGTPTIPPAPGSTTSPCLSQDTYAHEGGWVLVRVFYSITLYAPLVAQYFSDTPGGTTRTVEQDSLVQIPDCNVTQGQ